MKYGIDMKYDTENEREREREREREILDLL